MNAIFYTEKEAREFIKSTFGENAEVKWSEYPLSDRNHFDVDEMPMEWSGELNTLDVDGGEHFVGFWTDDPRELKFGNTVVKPFSVSKLLDSLFAWNADTERIEYEEDALVIFNEIADGGFSIEEIEKDSEDFDHAAKILASWNQDDEFEFSRIFAIKKGEATDGYISLAGDWR